MASATQEQVRRAIEQSGATGTAADVLATIAAKSIERTCSDPIDVDGLETRIPELAPGIIRKFKAVADQDGRLAAQFNKLCAVGLNFAHPDRRSQIDALVAAGVWTSEEGDALKGLGIWQESPLEVAANQRGVTTDEATVQAVLDATSVEAAQRQLRQKVTDAYNAVAAKVDMAEIATVEAALTLFTSVIQG